MALRPSVIIPTRNRAHVLSETLRSLARQSTPLPELEVVVIDDGSGDGTEALVHTNDYPFRLIYERLDPRPEFCPARPRNAGLQRATGDVAIFLDADVLAGPDLVAEHLAVHATNGPTQAVIGYTYGFPARAEERTPELMHAPPPERLLDELPRLLEADPQHWRDGREPVYAQYADLAGHPAPYQLFWTNNVSVSRCVALTIGGFDERFVGWGVEDFEFAYRLFQHGAQFALARRAAGVHYPHEIEAAADRQRQMERNRRRLIAKHPDLPLELQLWNWTGWPQALRTLRRAGAGWPPLTPTHLRAAQRLLDRAAPCLLDPGPLLWCAPARTASAPAPAYSHCQPFGLTSADDGPDEGVPLLGVYTPWHDNTFSGCFVADYWRAVPASMLEGMVREMLRVGRWVALIGPGAQDEPAGNPVRPLAECDAALKGLPSGYHWNELHLPGTTAFLAARAPLCASRRPEPGRTLTPPANQPHPPGEQIAGSHYRRDIMTPDENPRVTSDLSPGLLIQALEPLIEAIAEAVVQKIEEKRKIHAVAQAVMAKLAAESERLPEAATNGGADPSGELPPQADDIYRLVAAVLAPRNPPADPAPA